MSDQNVTALGPWLGCLGDTNVHTTRKSKPLRRSA